MRLKHRKSQPEETDEQMAKLGLLLERRGMERTMGEEQDGEVNDLINFLCTK